MDLLFLSEEVFLATNSPKEKQKITRVNLNSSVLEFDLHNILGLVRM